MEEPVYVHAFGEKILLESMYYGDEELFFGFPSMLSKGIPTMEVERVLVNSMSDFDFVEKQDILCDYEEAAAESGGSFSREEFFKNFISVEEYLGKIKNDKRLSTMKNVSITDIMNPDEFSGHRFMYALKRGGTVIVIGGYTMEMLVLNDLEGEPKERPGIDFDTLFDGLYKIYSKARTERACNITPKEERLLKTIKKR